MFFSELFPILQRRRSLQFSALFAGIRCTLPRDDVALHGTVPRDTILHIPAVRCPLNVRYPCIIVLAPLPEIFLAEREWYIVYYTCTFAALGLVGARVIGYLRSIPTVLAR